MNRAAPPASHARHEALRDRLLATVELLSRRRAGDIAADYIEDYVALHWLEWHAGTLRLTTTGSNVCRQLTLAERSAAPAAKA